MLGLGLSLPMNRAISAFAGAMDSYESGMVALVCPYKRLLTSWTGYAFTAQRADTTEMDVTYNGSGVYDAAGLTSWLAGQTWKIKQIYDQTGNGRHLVQATYANMPSGYVDGDGFLHAVSLPAGNSTTVMHSASGLAVATTNTKDTTWWGVVASPAASHLVGMTKAGLTSLRSLLNFGNSITNVVDDAGGAQISPTTPAVNSVVGQVNTSGNRVTNGTVVVNGTVGGTYTIDQLHLGESGAGTVWPQDARVYLGCWWSRMLSDSDADAVQAVGQALFITPAGNLWCWEPQDAMQWETGIDIELN